MKQLIAFLFFACLLTFTSFAQLSGPIGLTSAQSNFAQYLRISSVEASTNSSVETTTEFNNTEHTKGKRFLFNTWAKGSDIKDANNQAFLVSTYLFNYDMLTGNLLVTENKKNIMSVAPSGVKSFTLENNGKQYNFVHVTTIDSNCFFQRLAGSDSSFTLYKECKVKFIKSNYHNDGIIQTGNPDDEYSDISLYYITRPNEATFRRISFKPKEIKNLLVSEKETVSHYFSDRSDDEINEFFLVGLINKINKK